MTHVQVAATAGGVTSQDRHAALPNAIIVLDGATSPGAGERDGGWYADRLCAALAAGLDAATALPTLVAEAISRVAGQHSLMPGDSPSATVAALRWTADTLEGYMLGDSTIAVVPVTGDIEIVTDARLEQVALEQRRAYRHRLAAGGGYDDEHHALLRELVDHERRQRNSEIGYWIAEADPDAARHGILCRWEVRQLRAALVMTDGVGDAVGACRELPDWSTLAHLAVAHGGPAAVLAAARAAEDDDPNGRRWPRSKPHDDKTLAVVMFGGYS